MFLPEVKGFWRVHQAESKAHVWTIGDSMFYATLLIFSQNIQSELSSDVPSSSHRPYESVASVLTGDHDVENEVDLAE